MGYALRWPVIVVGLGAAAWTAAGLTAERLPELLLVVALYVAAHLLSGVDLPGGHRLSASILVLLPVAAVRDAAGMVGPALALAFGYRAWRGEQDPVRAAYNVAQLTLSTLVGAAVFRELRPPGEPAAAAVVGAALAAIACYQAVNTLLVSLWRAPEERRPFAQVYLAVLTREGHYAIWAVYALWPLPTLLVTEAYGYWGLVSSLASFAPVPHFMNLFARLRHTQQRLLLDELTQVYNYRYFAEWLRLEAPRHARARRPVALLVVDVDDLKAINDRHGHEAGNAVVCDLARRLRGLLRADDPIIRFGGDEFIALLPGARREEAERVAARLRAALEQVHVEMADGHVSYSATVGLACFPEDTDDVEQLFRLADERMYAAKER